MDELCDIIARLGEAVELEDDMGETARAELGLYMMYLCASDGKVAWQEAKTISDVCDVEFSTSEVKEYIEEGNLYSESFESTVPDSFTLAIILSPFLISFILVLQY